MLTSTSTSTQTSKPTKFAPVCGYCATGHHSRCPRTMGGGNFKLTICNCEHPTHKNTLVCRLCKRPGPTSCFDQKTNTCLDWEACAERQRKPFTEAPVVLPPDPEAMQNAKPHGTPRRRSGRTPKPCKCGCGGTTKGGNFLPGHDKRYITSLVRQSATARTGWILQTYNHLLTFSPKLAHEFSKESGLENKPRVDSGCDTSSPHDEGGVQGSTPPVLV